MQPDKKVSKSSIYRSILYLSEAPKKLSMTFLVDVAIYARKMLFIPIAPPNIIARAIRLQSTLLKNAIVVWLADKPINSFEIFRFFLSQYRRDIVNQPLLLNY